MFTFIVLQIIGEIKRVTSRTRKMQELAEREHLLYIDGDLRQVPDELLALVGSPLIVADAVFGKRRGEKVLSFDYASGWNRKFWRSVVAVEQKHPKDIPHTLRYQNWVIGRRGEMLSALLSPEGILRAWDKMQTATEEDVRSSASTFDSGEILIRPRHDRPRSS